MFTRPYLESVAALAQETVEEDPRRRSTMPCAPRQEGLPQLRAVDDVYGPDSLPTPLPPPSKTGIDGRYAFVLENGAVSESGVVPIGEVSKLDLVDENERLRSILHRVLSASVNDMPSIVADIRDALARTGS